MRIRRNAIALIAAPALVLAACSSGPDQPDTVAGEFADALNRGDIAAAAALTDNPAEASRTLGSLYDGMGAQAKAGFQVRSTDKTSFVLGADWKFGPDGKTGNWAYTTNGSAAEGEDGWKIKWNPAAIAPGLEIGPLTYSPVYPPAARVLDSAGGDLMTEQQVTLVNVGEGADTAGVAALLAPIDADITDASLRSDLAAAQGKTVTAISLREQDIAPIREQLGHLSGVTLAPQNRLLTTDKTMASPLLSGLAKLWQDNADANAGWAVRAQTEEGTQRIAGADPKPTHDLATTLDMDTQNAAEAALASIEQPAAIVALRPSNGEVVAAAQNDPADAQGPMALTGLYPPGSTFKTVTATAALAEGKVTPDTVLPCPGTADIEGRRIPNDNNFDLGAVPLHSAFAHSCNTTMGALGVQLPPDGLTTTAAQLGLGIDYITPGLTTVTGQVPSADTPAARVESAIGQGQVTASPFGMALVAAAVAHGTPPPPMLVRGQPGVPDKTPQPLPQAVLDRVKSMMRETITGGTATQLNDIPGLLGKTGTAEYIDDKHAHGWFVGIKDDLAFAVFISDAGSSTPAVDAAGRMLRALP